MSEPINSWDMKVGETYKLTQPFSMTKSGWKYSLNKGAVIKLLNVGSGWRNHTKLLIIKGHGEKCSKPINVSENGEPIPYEFDPYKVDSDLRGLQLKI